MSCFIVRGGWKWAAGVVLLVASGGMAAGSGPSNGTETYDLVIASGRVMDPESGLDAVRNVGIRGGKIAVISVGPIIGKQTIEAGGLVVAPGFIDLHQHGQDAENYAVKAADGVTTVLELEVGVADVDGWYREREGKALDLMTALKKMTLMPAQRLEMRAPMFKYKGRIRVGADADIMVFDANRVIDKAMYEKPGQYSEGIQFVLVNGVPVVKDGRLVDGVFPGRAARAPVSQ